MNWKGNQTPQKELPRSAESSLRRVKEAPSKSPSDQVKKPVKISKKCLGSAFAAIPEDQSPGKSASSSIDSSSSSVNSYCDKNKQQLSEVLELSMNPDLSVLPETIDPFEVSPTISIVGDNQETGSGVAEYNVSVDCDTPKIGSSIDVGIAVQFIREALFQASNSCDVDLRSKKILDSVVKIAIDDLYGFPEDRVYPVEVMSTKLRIGLLSLIWLVTFSVVAVALSNFFAGSPFPDPPPT